MKTDLSKSIIPLKDVSPGKYFHFGIANGIKNNYIFEHKNYILKLVIRIDGLPLTKSSTSMFCLFYVIYDLILNPCSQLAYIGATQNLQKATNF